MMKWTHKFKKDENGSVMIFTVIMFIVTIACMGFAVDVARFEARRAVVQTQLDNAALAAASLRQDVAIAPSVVVADYMKTVGISSSKTTGETFNVTYRFVEAQADVAINTSFMSMFGLNNLSTAVKTEAKERVPNVEMSLVLDISGSMGRASGQFDDAGNSLSRIEALKSAAQKFIDQMLAANDEENPYRISINLIPYNMQVNAGEKLYKAFTNNALHDYSYCADFDYNAYQESDWDESNVDHAGHIAYSNPWGDYDDRDYAGIIEPYCRAYFKDDRYEYAEVLPWSVDGDALKTRIEDMEAGGNTSIDVAAKWALLLLDPDSQDQLDDLATLWQVDPTTGGLLTQNVYDAQGNQIFADDGTAVTENIPTHRQAVDPNLTGRPVDYSDDLTMKVMVIMSDGENTTEMRLKSNYKSNNLSPVYVRNEDPSNWGNNDIRFYSSSGFNRMTYNEMWGLVPLKHYMYGRYGRTYRSSYWWTYVYSSSKNTRLKNICNVAKSKDSPVVVFSIAYLAPAAGQTALKDCATSDSFYHNADGANIGDIFSEIGGVIEKLKLVK